MTKSCMHKKKRGERSAMFHLLEVGTDNIGRDGGVTSAVFCRRYTTGGPGHLRFVQGFRARAKTCLAWTGPTAACYQSQLEVTADN